MRAVKKITKNKIAFMISPLNKALIVKKLFAKA